MFRYKSIREQLFDEKRKNEKLQAQVEKANADLEYIAMMADIDIEEDETEVTDDGNEQI
jgi:hypothetical protein